MRRPTRLLLSLGLVLSWTAAALAQVQAVDPQALAPVGVPSLLLGTPSAPAPILAAALTQQAAALAPLPAPAAGAYLSAQAVSESPAERAAAKISAARLSAAHPARSDARVRQLAESARTDPALAAWFDGAASAPSLELDGLTPARGGWRLRGKALSRLGAGDFGFVDAHPTVPGVVVKTAAHSPVVQVFGGQEEDDTANEEEATARALAAADAGPLYFGRATISGRHVSARERVFGRTVRELALGYAFGPEERELVIDLLRRLAAAGLRGSDMRPANIMIGRTLLDPRRRAYLVDGGRLSALPAGLDAAGRLNELLEGTVTLDRRYDPNVGWVEYAKPMRRILDEGVERSRRTTRWERVKGSLKDVLSGLF